MMNASARTCLIILLLVVFGEAISVRAQTQSGASRATAATAAASGVITGRVTLEAGAPAAGVRIVLLSPDNRGPQRQSLAKAVTDGDGRYRLTNIVDGRYHLRPIAPTHVALDKTVQEEPGKIINLGGGETIEDINFRLVPGGVITGRVTDADDQPVIGERVQLSAADQDNQLARSRFLNDFSRFTTDDRGVYRIYGLPAGRYVVSVGQSKEMGVFRRGAGYYTRTFYGGASEQAKAKVIEVTPGKETADVDIRLTARAETFRATGRVVDAESNQPLPGVSLGYGVLVLSGERSHVSARGQAEPSDANGRFRLEGLQSGRYGVYVASERNMMAESSGETYSEPTIFEVSDTNVSGIEVRVQRGSSLSGVAVIEGTSDKAVLARLSQLRIDYFPMPSQPAVNVGRPGFSRIAANGSFRLAGLAPGKISIAHIPGLPESVGITLRRVELNGVEHGHEFEIKAGEHVEGVRVVFAYGAARLRGQVNITGGTVPEDYRLAVIARRPESNEQGRGWSGEVDERGRFTIENLPEGEYELSVRVVPASFSLPPKRPMREPFPIVKQNVTVTNGIESQVALVLDLSGQAKEGVVP